MEGHKRLIELAVSEMVELIVFPELSLTGYEPKLAEALAVPEDDLFLDVFQKISDDSRITIGVGMPTKNDQGVLISTIIFQPHEPRQIYSKRYLHSDEYPYFIRGQRPLILNINDHKISIAICYELSVPEHSEDAYESGSEIYLASIAKSAEGIEKAIQTLSGIARNYSMIALMSNCIGPSDGFECGGKTSAWNNKGVLLGQLNDKNEGILIIDTCTIELIEKTID